MKNISVVIGAVCFLLGIVAYSTWDNFNYVSIPKPKESTKRTIAAESTGQQLIIDKFSEAILSIKSKEDVDKVLTGILEKASEYPQFVGVQFYGFLAELLPELKGVFWRLRGVVEDTEIVHIAALSRLRAFYHLEFAYGSHIKSIFRYLTDPVEGRTKFYKISEIQDYAYSNVRPILSKYLNLAVKSLEAEAVNHNFMMDRTLLIGIRGGQSLFDQQEARKEYIKSHTSFIISSLASSIGFIDYTSIYDVDDYSEISKKILRKTAINSVKDRFNITHLIGGKEVVKSLPYVLTMKEIAPIIKDFNNFGTLRKSVVSKADARVAESYRMFALSAEHNLKGYVCSIQYSSMIMTGQPIPKKYDCDWSFMEAEGFLEEEYFVVGGGKFVVDPNVLLINHRRKFNSLRDRYRMYHPKSANGVVEIVSNATGGVVRVNMKKAFQAHKDLKIFIPTAFETNGDFGGVRIDNGLGTYDSKKQWVWNYAYGRPMQWRNDAVTFGGLFPDANNNNIYDLMRNIQLTNSLRPLGIIFTSFQ